MGRVEEKYISGWVEAKYISGQVDVEYISRRVDVKYFWTGRIFLAVVLSLSGIGPSASVWLREHLSSEVWVCSA